MTTPTPTTGTKSKFAGDMTEETAEKILDEEASPPIKKITAAFNNAAGKWDQDQNLLYKLTTFTDAELKAIKQEATAAVTRNKGLNVNAAESLAFAAKAAGVDDTAAFIDNLVATDGNILGLKGDTLTKAGPFKFDVNSWLYEVKKHGAEHGLGYFADQIKLTEKTDATGKVVAATVEVDDPAVLREIASMRNNPRLSSVMGAHVFKEGKPPSLTYPGMTYTSDPDVLKNQQALQQLGFDIGPRRADGISGPLTNAAMRDFMHMRAITDETKAPEALQAAVEEAKKTAGIYIFDSKKRDWVRKDPSDKKASADPSAVRLDVKDAFALQISSERSGLKFNSLLNIVIAQRAFDKPGETPNRQPGLFAMSQGAWLATVAQYGDKYGLGDLVKQMKVDKDKDGNVTNVTVANPMVRKYILDLRKDPRVSAVMGGERALHGPIHLDIAEAWLGKTENRNKAELEKFFKTYGNISHNPSTAEAGDASAWCAVFVNTLMEATGRNKTDAQTMARSFINESYGQDVAPAKDFDRLQELKDKIAAKAGKKQSAGKEQIEKSALLDEIGARVKPGDIVVFPRGGSETFGHVAMIEECYKENGVWKIKVIGGNQGGAGDGGGVTIATRELDEVLGIRRPIPGEKTQMVANPQPEPVRRAAAAAAAPKPG